MESNSRSQDQESPTRQEERPPHSNTSQLSKLTATGKNTNKLRDPRRRELASLLSGKNRDRIRTRDLRDAYPGALDGFRDAIPGALSAELHRGSRMVDDDLHIGAS